jgi:hypothetical protein
MEVSADELLQFVRGDWPRCCILPMILELDGTAVGPMDKTDLERPSRPARKMFPD